MSDYLFMLENHLTADQSRVVNEVQAAAAEANVKAFLTGGALRDMICGFPIREIEFTVEGPAIKLARAVAQKTGAELLSEGENESADGRTGHAAHTAEDHDGKSFGRR